MKFLQTLEPNTAGRDFVVGDLHGSLPALVNLLANVQFDETKDRLISVGDLVDRGPDSVGVLALLNEPWFFAVRGNHEHMMINSFQENEQEASFWVQNWMNNGGIWAAQALTKYDGDARNAIEHLVEKSAELPYLITIERPDGKRFHVLHAELPPQAQGITDAYLEDEEHVRELATALIGPESEAFLWTRELFRAFAYQNLSNLPKMIRSMKYYFKEKNSNPFNPELSHIISGHSIVNKPITILGQTNIDTGAFRMYRPDGVPAAARLTMVDLGAWKFYQGTDTEFNETDPIVINMDDINQEAPNETD